MLLRGLGMMTRSRIELRRARLRRQGSSSTKITNQQAAFSKVMYKSFKARYIQVLLDIRDIRRGKFTILRTKCTQLRRSFSSHYQDQLFTLTRAETHEFHN